MKSKKAYYIILIVAIVLALIIVALLQPHEEKGKEAPPFPGSIFEELDEDYYINSVKGHDEREQIVGNFSGKMVDTLTIVNTTSPDEDVDGVFQKWKIVSSLSSVPSLIISGLCPLLVYEGDLDRNGTDEFGILETWDTSVYRTYYVYTFYKNEWRYLIHPFGTAESLRASGKDLVRQGEHKGEVIVTKSDFEAEDSTFADAPDIDIVIKPTFEKIQ